jgi:hypothetical protein
LVRLDRQAASSQGPNRVFIETWTTTPINFFCGGLSKFHCFHERISNIAPKDDN